MLRWFARPMQLFGLAGIASWFIAGLAAVALVAMKLAAGIDMTGNPMLLLTVFSGMAGIQFFSLGLLGEVNARTYFASRQRPSYHVRERLNFEGDVEHRPPTRRAA